MVSVWVIRGGRNNRLVDEFVDTGVTGVGYFTVPDARNLDRAAVEVLLREEGTSASVEWHSQMLIDFVQVIAPGDVVIMPDTPRGEVVIGEVTGPYEFHPEVPADHYRHRRAVAWLGRHIHADLPPGRQDIYHQRSTLLRLHAADDLVAHMEHVRRHEVGRPAKDRAPATAQRSPAMGSAGGGPSVSSGSSERMCSGCFQVLKASAFPAPDAHRCRTCEDG